MRFLLVLLLLFLAVPALRAVNPPPVNDTVCDATDLGVLDIPGLCPVYPYGDTVFVNGTTEFATYNTFDYSPLHCFNSGAPDVWYQFNGTGSNIYIEMTGYNDLDSFYVKLFLSQGSCITLVPMKCEMTTNGFLAATFQTPEIGGKYFLQIGGSTYDETGNFSFFMKAYNECSGCVKNADIDLEPAPWFGRYGTRDTVKMCVTVDRWELLTSSNLHSIVPVFGDDWDTSTIVPLVTPYSSNGQWDWFTNVTSPPGTVPGFFFDSDLDGDPTNNAGESGNVLTSWTGCWQISTKPSCSNYDLTVDINIWSDDVTGTGNSNNVCLDVNPVHLGIVGWCCADPVVTVFPGTNCTGSAYMFVQPQGAATLDTVNVVLYDTAFNVVGYVASIGTPAYFGALFPGDYIVEVYNATTQCIGYSTVNVPEHFSIEMFQTAIGCGPGTGSATAMANGSFGPYTYSWVGITNWTDSAAYALNEGFAVVQVTDIFGCTLTDSIYVNVLSAPDAQFSYASVSRCRNEDTIQVSVPASTPGGSYALLSPTSSSITVDPLSGTIALNSTTLVAPFWVIVKYTVGTVCQTAWVDSVYIVEQPATPVPVSQAALNWCISNTPPTLSIIPATGISLWYDWQTTGTGLGYSYTPTLNASSPATSTYYSVVYSADVTGGCTSAPFIFGVTAVPSPSVVMSSDTTICEGESATIYALSGPLFQYSWAPTPTSGVATLPSTTTSPASTTTYVCSVTESGCTTSGTVTINVQSATDCEFQVYNGFTPNGDGHNDTWIIDGADASANMTVTIYNRWGSQVWQHVDYDNTSVVWDGKDQHGALLPEGTYYYTIFQLGHDRRSGWVELTR